MKIKQNKNIQHDTINRSKIILEFWNPINQDEELKTCWMESTASIG